MIGNLVKRALDRLVPASRFITRGRSPHVFLTFDDGPHPVETPLVLDALRNADVRATFFVVGNAARAHPGLVRRIVTEGHAIGHHSFTHSSPATTSAATLAAEARETSALLAGMLGRPVRLFRPPNGAISARKLTRLLLLGQSVVFWSLDPQDYAYRDGAELSARLARALPRARDIVLLHDDNPLLAPALPAYIAAIRAAGLDFRPLPD